MQCNKGKRRLPLLGRGFAGLCAALAMAAAGSASAAPTETVLHSFTGSGFDGANPAAGLIADRAGNLYSTTRFGGAGGATTVCGGFGCGVVFKLSPGGTERVLYSFCSLPPICSDGFNPDAGLIADGAGNLYGTTFGGRVALLPATAVVFKLSPTGTETVLHSFTISDGANPAAGLIADRAGNLYGTTYIGGAGVCVGFGCGVVFKLSPGGTETVLHSFTVSDGALPSAGLIADRAGNLYGTTRNGGAGSAPTVCGGFRCGVVFKLSPGGTETLLYSFCSLPSCSDGTFPEAGLIADRAGNLYGTTYIGGAAGNGVVFKLSPGGTETVLHSFTVSDGANPAAGLIADRAGNLYGTTQLGGAAGHGVVFRLSPSGTSYTVLHSFTGGDGAGPVAGLIADSFGNLYGTTLGGGASGKGVVFKLTGAGFIP
jgi:uncharacterized repeat protein (TIGR03803 family)